MAEPATKHGNRSNDKISPSPWICRFAPIVPPGGRVLDVACGSGRHTRHFLSLGHAVTAVDIDLGHARDLSRISGLELVEADLEADPWPFSGRTFAAVVVTNYLWRPLFPVLLAAIGTGGVLLYETFAEGNERFGRPTNSAYLLAPGELLERVRGTLEVTAYEHGIVNSPRPAMVQRIAAFKPASAQERALPIDAR